MIDIRTVTATRYVAALREGGSLPGLMEADDLGTYVVKFRGAAQGVRTLIAEHVLLPIASSISEAGAALRPKITPDAIPAIVNAVPDDWLSNCAPFTTPADLRQAYVDLILTRLSIADSFEAEAERARERILL